MNWIFLERVEADMPQFSGNRHHGKRFLECLFLVNVFLISMLFVVFGGVFFQSDMENGCALLVWPGFFGRCWSFLTVRSIASIPTAAGLGWFVGSLGSCNPVW